MKTSYQAVICGAGITGVSAAYFLAQSGLTDVLLLDERPPLTLTSDRSTECYRNWWPDPEMLALMNRSIDLMERLAEASGNVFRMNRRGYLYVTGSEPHIAEMHARAEKISHLGAGELRIHSAASSSYEPPAAEGLQAGPPGADLLLGGDLIHKHFPYLTSKAVAALHVRRAGWLSAQQLGMHLLEGARSRGVEFASAHLDAVQVKGGRVQGVKLASGERVGCQIFVNAAGPYLQTVGRMLELDLPVHTEIHLKVAFKDHLGAVGREAPLLIWDDPQSLAWDAEERQMLANDPELRWLTEPFPSGAHTRPEGTGESNTILMLWEYRSQTQEPVFPTPLDDQYPEVALRGLSVMLPRLHDYFGRAPRPILDGGYYTRTPENRLLVGPLPVQGAFAIGAVSGYGIMSACGAGELLAAHVAGSSLPAYARVFSLQRYEDPKYRAQIRNWELGGQL